MGKIVWKLAKRLFLSVLTLLLVLAAVGYAYRAYRLNEIAKAVQTPNGIDEAMFVKIGGVDQWVTIRGQNRDNPVLFLLHGGPGFASLSASPWAFLGWERDFTMVQWDQRGAGKTYGKSGPLDPSVTIDRMARDGLEVAEFVRGKLQKQKIILVGLSWGTILGVHMAKARPDLFYAYVGTGQYANYQEGKAVGYRQLLTEARVRTDLQALKELEAIGPPPYESASEAGIQTKWSYAYEPGPPGWSNIPRVLFESPITFRDGYHLIRGMTESEDHFRNEIEAVDLPALGTDFAIPIFVFEGALDNIAPALPLKAYVDSIRAPQKELVVVANAGHNFMITESAEFLTLLVGKVRPLAQ